MKTKTVHHRPPDRRRAASALVVALWVLTLLALLIGSFAFDMHLESRITSYYRKRLKAEYAAKGGLDMAQMLLTQSGEIKTRTFPEKDKDKFWYTAAKRLSEGLAVSGFSFPIGEGTLRLDIVPEPSRRNINRLSNEDWERILDLAGVPEEKWEGLIAAFFDWTDPDDDPRPNGGAESEYYETLKLPYMAKNGPVDTVEEILLIKGFIREILHGGLPPDAEEGDEPWAGMADTLTVFGDGRVNVNAAPARILMSLPGIAGDEELAEEIIVEREGLTEGENMDEDISFKDANDFFNRVPELVPYRSQLEPLITMRSGIYRISSAGVVHGVERRISCIAEWDGSALRILRWWE